MRNGPGMDDILEMDKSHFYHFQPWSHDHLAPHVFVSCPVAVDILQTVEERGSTRV